MLDLMLRFSALPAMAAVVLANHLLHRARERRRIGREAARLACLLAVELQSLREHYTDILSLLSGAGRGVLPLRGSGTMYRTNASRLTGLLDEAALVPLVACHAHHERIEALMQACMKPNSGCLLRPDVEEANVIRLRERLAAGRDLAEAAIGALVSDRSFGDCPEPAMRPARTISHATDNAWSIQDNKAILF